MNELANIRQVSPEVFYSDGQFRAVGAETCDVLKAQAALSPRRRCRLCFHAEPSDRQQEMLIAMHRTSYVRPHRHRSRLETLAIFEGRCETLLFDERGTLTDRVPMSTPQAGGAFFYRMPAGLFHTLSFSSDWLIWTPPKTSRFEGFRGVMASSACEVLRCAVSPVFSTWMSV